jgi:signal transduction histidine kinase
MRMTERARNLVHLRSVLMSMGLIVLVLPVAALGVLRLFETEILRQTESELLAQAALVAPAWRSAWIEENRARGVLVMTPAIPLALREDSDDRLDPLRAQLDLATADILEPGPDAVWTPFLPDPVALRAGEHVTGLVREGVRRTLAGVRIVDARGIVVASSSGEVGLSIQGREEVQRALAGEAVSLLRRRYSDNPRPEFGSISRRTAIRVFVAQPIKYGTHVVGAVLLSRTPDSVTDVLWRSRHSLLASVAVLVAVVALVAFLAATWVSKPIQELIARAEQVATGGRFNPLAKPRLIEVQRLSSAIDAMARALDARATYIKDFASHVSHEFKTPLTTITGSLELLRDNLGRLSPVEQERLFALMEGDTARLRALVVRLLDLAHADMTVAAPFVRTELRDVVREACLAFPELRVDFSPGSPDQVNVAMDIESTRSVIFNLVENAFRHGGRPVSISVKVDSQPVRLVRVSVHDSGSGISMNNQQKIFEPFFTTARSSGGTGLGLAIVKTLATSHGGDVKVQSVEGRGTTFTVTLPHPV